MSIAWLLQLSGGQWAALGEAEILYVLPELPPLHVVPLAPPHARNVIVWEQRIVPLMDAGQLLARARKVRPIEADDTRAVVAIVAVDDARGGDGYSVGALLLRAVPQRIEVHDHSDCALPANLVPWEHVLDACFLHSHDQPVPILNLAALFMASHDRRSAALPTASSSPAHRSVSAQIGD